MAPIQGGHQTPEPPIPLPLIKICITEQSLDAPRISPPPPPPLLQQGVGGRGNKFQLGVLLLPVVKFINSWAANNASKPHNMVTQQLA